ncbi:MAG: two-component sensor histidine kinase [Solirubrobacterales bacterium]|nr:two-component sensor histidine kinase [Solirubrobacterales bacterium]MBV9048670.1 two-component sensor histidine kinase [Solirubrobacterales bacterium]
MSQRRLLSWDVALAAAAAAALIVEGQLRSSGGLSAGDYLLAIAAAAPLAWRSRAPLAALIGVELGTLLCAAAFDASWSATAIVLLQLFTVALVGSRGRSLVVGAISAMGVVVAVVLIDGTVELTGALLRVALVFAAVAAGDTIRSRGALRAAARERAEREHHEREETAKRRAAAERLRIAQELHDTLAHSLVAINVRSSVALDLGESEDPAAALEDIKQVSATALRDLRATLNLLREQDDVVPTSPASDLDAVPGLIDQVRGAGLRAELDVRLGGAVVPSVVGAAAYRIVQEALTNVLRHANATKASVRVRERGATLDIEITDDGRVDNTGARPGLGLQGMAERSAALGGRLDVGPQQEGGWRVRAMLPLRAGDGE